MSTPTVSTKGNSAKKHLYPSKNRVRFPKDSVGNNDVGPYSFFIDVKLEINTNKQLGNDRNEQNGPESAVDRAMKLPALVSMSQEITSSCKGKSG